MNSQALMEALNAAFGDKLQSSTLAVGEVTIELAAADLLAVCAKLRDDKQFGFEQLIDLCGVDYSAYGEAEWDTESASSSGFSRAVDAKVSARLRFGDEHEDSGSQRPRFAVVYHLMSVANNHRLRLRVYCDSEDVPVVPSVLDIWPAANWFEREAFDLFGIIFDGHPDLRRILTDYGFVGHPFRKDFPLVGHVEMIYDEQQKRVVYQPVSIEPRVLVPRVIRDEGLCGKHDEAAVAAVQDAGRDTAGEGES